MWQQPTIVKKREVLDPSGERVASTDNCNVAMLLLAASWLQKHAAAAQLHRKGAATHQPQVMFPFYHKRSDTVVRVFFQERASLQ